MIGRRRMLRGVLNGAAVTVALPLLNCFLDGNGTALADGRPMPLRFGTWFWGLGMDKSVFVPKKIGADYDLPEELEALRDVKQHVNVFTGFNVMEDDSPSLCHYSGWVALRCGAVPASRTDLPGESIDVAIARKIGGFTRFRSLDATATGDPKDSFSFLGPNAYNTPESSPFGLYRRIFGPEFQDPNGASFTPDPRLMVRQSVLSGMLDDVKALSGKVGAEDKARLDQYFTGLRDVENQLAHQLEKPTPVENFHVPKAPQEEWPAGLDQDLVTKRHKVMTDILVMALACDQTRVFNMAYSAGFSFVVRPGGSRPHHVATHEELIDEALGYQPLSSWYTRRAMESWAYFVKALADVREGGGTLLDNSLIYANSDHAFAKQHSMDGIPMFTAGRAGGRVKTGLHVAGGQGPGTRLGYTLQKTMGVEIANWGTKSNNTAKAIGEILT